MRRPRVFIVGIIGLAVALYFVCSSIISVQRTIIYSPRKYTREQELMVLEKYGLSTEMCVDLISADKTRLRAYWLPMKNAESTSPTVLYLHGNMGKIEWGLSSGRSWQKHMSVNFFVLSYRGFGRSEGEPDMEGVRKDSQAALDYLLTKEGIDRNKIVVYGHSLGGSVALHLVADNPGRIAAIVVENTFLKIARVICGNDWLSKVVDLFIKDRWDNEIQVEKMLKQSADGYRVPHILLLSGQKDLRVPSWHTEMIWSAIHKRADATDSIKMTHQFVDGAHTCHVHPEYHLRIKSFLDRLLYRQVSNSSSPSNHLIVQKIRENATNALEAAAHENFGVYMSTLCNELCDERQQGGEVRQAAGVALKNALVSKDANVRNEYGNRWVSISEEIRQRMKTRLLGGLGSRNAKARTAIAQAITAIAFVELPLNGWPDLMRNLLEGAQSPDDNIRQCAIETIGFICEEIEPATLEMRSNEILTAVINGLRAEEKSPLVKAAAANALLNSVEFIRSNFDREAERDIIMSVICNATQIDDDSIRIPAFECLVRILQVYYPQMQSYMEKGVAALTINSMTVNHEPLVLQAIEFWSTVCDIERDLQEAETCEFECLDFSRLSLGHLLPNLLRLLKQQNEDAGDEWNTSMAAGTCLSLLAECVKNDIFYSNILLQFVQDNIMSSDWRCREAAVMAYGSVMDGPDTEHVQLIVEQGLLIVLKLLDDPSVAVRDTAAWAVGRVVDFFFEIIPETFFPNVVSSLMKGVGDAPRVASNCCWSLMSMAVHYGDDSNELVNSAISPYWSPMATALFSATKRSDADENNLRVAAFQALATLVLFAPMDCIGEVGRLQVVIVNQLGESQRMADMIVNVDDRIRYSDLQSNLCTVLSNSIKKLGKPSIQLADQVMTSVMTVFANAARGKGSATELEDVFLLVGTLVSELETEFLRFVDPFMPILYGAIGNHAERNLCGVAIGVVGDLARALGQLLLPYCDSLINNLFQALQDTHLGREVRPHAINALGDVTLAIGGSAFAKYLQSAMFILAQAGELSVTNHDDFDEIDLVCDIRESILHSYTGIVQGCKDDQQATIALSAYVPQIIHLVKLVSSDLNQTDSMVRAAIGLVGDLTETYKTQMRPMLRDDWLLRFIQRPLDSSASEATLNIVKWTQSVLDELSLD